MANQYMILAMEKHLLGRPRIEITDVLSLSVKEMVLAVELGYTPQTFELWDYFLTALLVRDFSAAYFLASIPEQYRLVGEDIVDLMNTLASNTAFALLKRQFGLISLWLESYRQVCFSPAGSEGLRSLKAEFENIYFLFEAIYQNSEKSFDEHLSQRMSIREQRLLTRARLDPLTLVDVQALGLVRLAAMYGIAVSIRHTRLPLQWLEGEGKDPDCAA